MATRREMSSFECSICGATLDSWNTAWVPAYRLVSVERRSKENSA
jgi:hypothetical protein